MIRTKGEEYEKKEELLPVYCDYDYDINTRK